LREGEFITISLSRLGSFVRPSGLFGVTKCRRPALEAPSLLACLTLTERNGGLELELLLKLVLVLVLVLVL